jgi:hypothetical protein
VCPVATTFHLLVPLGCVGRRVSRVVADQHNAPGPNPNHLGDEERERIERVVHHEARPRPNPWRTSW